MNWCATLLCLLFGVLQLVNAPACPYQDRFGARLMGSFADENCLGGLHCAVAPNPCPDADDFRSFDGSCNNKQAPTWGQALTRYERLLPANYADKISTFATAKSGSPLPNARAMTVTLHTETSVPDLALTLINMQFGQFVAHDCSLKAGSCTSLRNASLCCTLDGHKLPVGTESSPYCAPIDVNIDDPVYGPANVQCLEFRRTVTDLNLQCPKSDPSNVAADQLSMVTSYLDLSTLYSSSAETNQQTRTHCGGQFIMGHNNMPMMADDPYDVCDVPASWEQGQTCFNTGFDIRINQNTELTALTTLMLREHNRLAWQLQRLNPHWDDERIFQEARKIHIGQHQRIIYYEWLPNMLGYTNMVNAKLIYENVDGQYVNDYDDSVNAAVLNEFANAAFRYFHSNIEGKLKLLATNRTTLSTVRLRDWFNNPKLLGNEWLFDEIVAGMCTQPQQSTDGNIDPDVRDFLFPDKVQKTPGSDLIAIDIMRARDHGLAFYNDYRERIGLKRATTWQDFTDNIIQLGVNGLQQVYENVDDVELTVAGAMETHLPDALAGPIFHDIISEQFLRWRVGDRYFFENNADEKTSFTLAQLAEIRKASMARIVCDNCPSVQYIQSNVFKLYSNSNPLKYCSQIRQMNLAPWREDPPPNCQQPKSNWYDNNAYANAWRGAYPYTSK